jgi:vancomycin resistance protein YoaR
VDAVIQDGKFEESVGGGISQFATTLFNAAFFAGLEFPEYQSHSLYISRYPYGREATLSYPRPDLQIRNPSPYPILIWPTYTRSSITVGLYSTKWVNAEQTGQSEESRGPCKLVRTERTITYLADNTTKVDRVNALYRPAEGVNCV